MENWLTRVNVVLVILGALRADDLLVRTPSGPIRGTTTKSYTEKDVSVFYGIPYAKPPVGGLRFSAPIEMTPWGDELNATTPSLPCYQRITNSKKDNQIIDDMVQPKKPWSEDCMKLHIWTPIPRRTNSTVMVYIHGGGFTNGHPLLPIMSGATLAAEESIIVVSMNYRLNVQGFLYLDVPEAPGNMGLMDQQMALKWVRRNIASFGGNPDDVTIFGMSAGGCSVGFQMMSAGSRDLFKRAILMSGTPNAVWAVDTKEEALDKSLKLGKFLGCDSKDKAEVLKCMQALEPSRLSDWETVMSSLGELRLAPTVDGSFISDHPMNLLRKKEVKQADVIIGGTSDEGSLFMRGFFPDILTSGNNGITKQQFLSSINSVLMMYSNGTRKVISSVYTDWSRPEDRQVMRDAFKSFYSDYVFNCPAEDFSDLFLAAKNTVYRYVVNHVFTKLPIPKWVGTPHGLDTALHLGAATQKGSFLWNTADSTLSRRVMRWFANFARTGNPNGHGQSGPTWLEYTTADKYFLGIGADLKMLRHYLSNSCSLIKDILSECGK